MKTKKVITLLFILFILLYLSVHFIWYGSIIRNCIYTEDILQVPQQLIDGKIVVAKDAYVGVGHDKDYSCLQNFDNIDREIINPKSIDDISVGRKYFINKGLKIESLKKNTTLTIVNVIAVTKHGLSAIDSGSGPIYFLILKDQNNILYKIATVSLGINKDDLFLSFVDSPDTNNSSIIKLLSANSFKEGGYYEKNKKYSIEYTGELTELSDSYLKNTEPYWKKLSDRLKNGEELYIQIEIDLRTDGFKKIILSDNPNNRSKQIADIQNEFLKKIPNDITLENINKDQYYPYITMKANLKLLNYLVDERVNLKIKTISEFIQR